MENNNESGNAGKGFYSGWGFVLVMIFGVIAALVALKFIINL